MNEKGRVKKGGSVAAVGTGVLWKHQAEEGGLSVGVQPQQ